MVPPTSPFAPVAEASNVESPTPPGFLRRNRFRARIILASDMIEGGIAAAIAFVMRNALLSTRQSLWISRGGLLTGCACAAVLILSAVLYSLDRRGRLAPASPAAVLKAYGLASLLAFAGLFLLRSAGNQISRPTLGLFAAVAAAIIALSHWTFRVMGERSKRRTPVQVLVIGRGSDASRLVRHLTAAPEYVVEEMHSDNIAGGEAVEATLAQVCAYLRERAVDEVVLTPAMLEADHAQARFFQGIVELCQAMGIQLHVWADWVPGHGQVDLDFIGGNPVLTYSYRRASLTGLLLKRIIDLAVTLLLLPVALPVVILAMIAIRLDTPGSALFRQKRCGLRGRPFEVYKLRTMRSDAPALEMELRTRNELSGPAFKMTSDPRITRVGRFLRRSSVDELPQLLNVLRGEMSLVGPRPAPLDEAARYPTAYLRKLAMKPGMTGLWQVSGRTKITDFESRLDLDVAYIRKWSIGFDCWILVRTVGEVLRLTGV